MGMFDSFEIMKVENKDRRYRKRLAENRKAAEPKSPMSSAGSDLNAIDLNANGTSSDSKEAPKKRPQTLKEKIDVALDDVHEYHPLAGYGDRSELTVRCEQIRDDPLFSQLITATILVVGLMIGLETDRSMECARTGEKCDEVSFSTIVGVLSQTIFTWEAGVKILAEVRN